MTAAELRLYWRIQLVAHHMQKYADRELVSAADITTAQIGVLTVILNRTEVNQKDVAQALGLNESAVTAMVKRLIALEYIEYRISEKDRRVKLLSLTRRGKAAQKSAKLPFKRINRKIEKTLTHDEIAAFAECADRLREAFENEI